MILLWASYGPGTFAGICRYGNEQKSKKSYPHVPNVNDHYSLFLLISQTHTT